MQLKTERGCVSLKSERFNRCVGIQQALTSHALTTYARPSVGRVPRTVGKLPFAEVKTGTGTAVHVCQIRRRRC